MYNSAKFDINNMVLPGAGPVALPQSLDFSATTIVDLDFTESINNGWIDWLSGVYIDNSGHANVLTIECNGTNQIVKFPANSSGYIPLLITNPAKLRITSAGTGSVIKAHFYNIPMLPYIIPDAFPTGGNDFNLNEIGGVPLTSEVLKVESDGATIADYSLTLDATNQTAIAAGEANKYLLIQNPAGNSTVTINLAGGDASATGIDIPGNGSLELVRGVANAITVFGNATETLIVFGGA